MSHFVTLVDFYMPEVEENLEETAHYKAQIAEAKEALAQSQGGPTQRGDYRHRCLPVRRSGKYGCTKLG